MDATAIATIERYQAKLVPLEAQVKKLKDLINGICDAEGQPPMYTDAAQPPQPALLAIRADQYFGRPMATCVREILEYRAQQGLWAISTDELFALLTKGGHALEGKDEAGRKRTMAITIGKNPVFVRVPNTDHIGLAEWYPTAKRKAKNGDTGNGVRHDDEAPPADTNPDQEAGPDAPDAPQRAPSLFPTT
jgi:hypothetical protein